MQIVQNHFQQIATRVPCEFTSSEKQSIIDSFFDYVRMYHLQKFDTIP